MSYIDELFDKHADHTSMIGNEYVSEFNFHTALTEALEKQRELDAIKAGKLFMKFANEQNINEEERYFVIHLQDSIRANKLEDL